MRKPRSVIAAAVTAFCVLPLTAPAIAAATTPAPATSAARLALPEPTGPAAVGRSTLALTDRDRTDPWVPEAGPRRLMVTLYYPAVRGTGSPAPYLDLAEATALVDFAQLGPEFTAQRLADTRTWSRTDARALPGRRPLGLLS